MKKQRSIILTTISASVMLCFHCANAAGEDSAISTTTGSSVTTGSVTGGSATGGSATATGGSATATGGSATGGSATAGSTSAGRATDGQSSAGTATAYVSGREVTASADNSVSVHTEGSVARVHLNDKILAIEQERILLDNKVIGKIPANAKKLKITLRNGNLTIQADGTEVISEHIK